MTEQLARAYRHERREGHPAHVALAIARQKIAVPSWRWKDGVPYAAQFEQDGFTVRVRVDYEDHIDLGDHIDLTVDWVEDDWQLPDRHRSVYRNPNGSLVHNDDTWSGMVWKGYSHRYAYCVPQLKVAELAAYYHDHDGQSRSVAIDQAREAVRSVVELYADDSYCEYVITVTVLKNGIELGSDSLGGVDIDSRGPWGYDEVQFERIIADHGMIDQALEEARETLEGLCA